VFVEEESAQCEFGTPLVDGDRAGAEDLVGVSLLHFDADGLVVEEWDIWVERQSAGEPPWAGAR
jgi:hypothetical protein